MTAFKPEADIDNPVATCRTTKLLHVLRVLNDFISAGATRPDSDGMKL